MLLGVVLHDYIGYVAFLSKYLIFVMLLITYCRVKPHDFHVGPYVWKLLCVQIGGAIVAYVALRPLNPLLAQGAFICFFCPTATAAPVITGMLGGSVAKTATYSTISHLTVAFLAPLSLAFIGDGSHISFMDSTIAIGWNVLPLILGPLAIALAMQRFAPGVHRGIANHQGLSFYIWAVALLLVVGNSVSFLLREPTSLITTMLLLGAISLAACITQFVAGRIIGIRYGDPVSGAQSLGQKNTVLAIWLTLSYLDPVVSTAPAAYVAWHNVVNSWQIYRNERGKNKPDTI